MRAYLSAGEHTHFPYKRGLARTSEFFPFFFPTEQGEPRFLGIEHCQYRFNWDTAAACAQEAAVGTNCVVIDRATTTLFDLSPLADNAPYYTVRAPNGRTYELSVCAPLQVCARYLVSVCRSA